MSTLVIFRKWRKEGDILALFPEMKEGTGLCNSYTHIGQHTSAQYGYLVNGWYGPTVPAKPEEYADLLAELISIGYDDLKIRQKWIRRNR